MVKINIKLVLNLNCCRAFNPIRCERRVRFAKWTSRVGEGEMQTGLAIRFTEEGEKKDGVCVGGVCNRTHERENYGRAESRRNSDSDF